MANAREILSRMKSVQDTRKITNAMYLISSTKLKKSKKLLEETEPYFYTLQDLIRRILRHMPDVEHFYFNPRKEIKEEDRVKGLIVITGDKGLAGAYNHNVLKMAQVIKGLQVLITTTCLRWPRSGWNRAITTVFMWWGNWDAIILPPSTYRWRSSSIIRYRIPPCTGPG